MITEGTIQNHPPLKEKLEKAFDFRNIISTGSLDLDKKKPEAYKYVVAKLEVDPGKVLFLDDSADNANAALQVGLQAVQIISEEQAITELKNRLDI